MAHSSSVLKACVQARKDKQKLGSTHKILHSRILQKIPGFLYCTTTYWWTCWTEVLSLLQPAPPAQVISNIIKCFTFHDKNFSMRSWDQIIFQRHWTFLMELPSSLEADWNGCCSKEKYWSSEGIVLCRTGKVICSTNARRTYSGFQYWHRIFVVQNNPGNMLCSKY